MAGRTTKVKPDADAEAAAKKAEARWQELSDDVQRRLAEQRIIGDALREHVGEPDRGIKRARRIGLKPPKTMQDLDVLLHAADTFNAAARSGCENMHAPGRQSHADSVQATATVSAYRAMAAEAVGFEEISRHCPRPIVTSEALGRVVEKLSDRSGTPCSDLWAMPTGDFAAMLDQQHPYRDWLPMGKHEAKKKFSVKQFRFLRDRGVAIDDPPNIRTSKRCLVRPDSIPSE